MEVLGREIGESESWKMKIAENSCYRLNSRATSRCSGQQRDVTEGSTKILSQHRGIRIQRHDVWIQRRDMVE